MAIEIIKLFDETTGLISSKTFGTKLEILIIIIHFRPFKYNKPSLPKGGFVATMTTEDFSTTITFSCVVVHPIDCLQKYN